MSADKLLSLLCNVRLIRPGNWMASCPAHEDHHPSLSIREMKDGRVLLHDFAGCSVAAILAATALTFEDLFPEPSEHHHIAGIRRPFHATDVLRCIAFEALVVSIAASQMGRGSALSGTDRRRLLLAASRLQAAMEAYNG